MLVHSTLSKQGLPYTLGQGMSESPEARFVACSLSSLISEGVTDLTSILLGIWSVSSDCLYYIDF